MPRTAFALVTVGDSKDEPWDVDVLGFRKRDILEGLNADGYFKSQLPRALDAACSVHVATATAAGLKGETELTGADEVSEVGNRLVKVKPSGKTYVCLRIELVPAAGNGGGGGGGGPIGALLLCGRR